MLTRAGALLVVAGCFTGMLGCVSADVYRVKEREVLTLQRTNEEMQEQNNSLIAERTELKSRVGDMKNENEALQDQIGKQSVEIDYLKNRAEKLERESEGLRERAEKLKAKIAELNKENQRLATLTRPENLLRTLGERLADLQKQVEALSGENEKLKSKRVIARSEEEKTGGVTTIKSTGEKPQAVPVSAGQKAEDSKPDQQVQEEQEPRALSEDREKPSDNP